MTNADPLIERYERLSIGDTMVRDGHELMWDGGQWKHSPDCHDDAPDGIEV